MANTKKLIQAAAGAAGGEALNIEDVFSTYLWTSDSSSSVTVNNGIDLDGEGGMVWIKSRSNAVNHVIVDTERVSGTTDNYLMPNLTNAETAHTNEFGSFTSTGFTVPYNTEAGYTNFQTREYASWTFRKAPKFFDVVTYTGDGVSGKTVSHNLGSVPGMILIKCTSLNSTSWVVWHRSLTNANYYMSFNTTDQEANGGGTFPFNGTAPTDLVFSVADGSSNRVNASGQTYIAYLFAHNDGDGEFGPTGDQDIIKCGSYTTDASADATINLGWEPQWVLFRPYDDTSNWKIVDNMRGFVATAVYPTYNQQLAADTSGAEAANDNIQITSTGFDHVSGFASKNFIYIAIRRGPMAVPTDATDVFAIDQGDGSSTDPQWVSNFPVDMGIWKRTSGSNTGVGARLLQGRGLFANLTQAENAQSLWQFDHQDGWYDAALDTSYYSWMWKRAPSFCDVVAYTGDGTTGRTVSHNLGVAPEMMWVKRRDAAQDWKVYHTGLTSASYFLDLNGSAAESASTVWAGTDPTDAVFSVGSNNSINASGGTYIAYLFASVAGVSKVGSYTGNGTSQNIDCGFSSGARFVLIKSSTQATEWFLFDTERGIVSGNDPALLLDTTDAEYTSYDLVDPYSSGFAVNYVGAFNGTNTSGQTYIFYAIA